MSHDLHTLQPFIDGELTEAERAEVEAQLARDPAMREVAEEQLRIRQLLRDLPRATARRRCEPASCSSSTPSTARPRPSRPWRRGSRGGATSSAAAP
ncbi:anti-sigma factor family protein [Nannocystis pusilla]|uniref:anti-sigma factor family protein n=1 Tax=Nannocystis pusilla TaxID=889268 RepID=UPI003B75FDB4